MRLMLTSFGIESEFHVEPVVGLEEGMHTGSMFHRMPPVSFRTINEAFLPDYALLLLCDEIVMDEPSFDRLLKSSPLAYSGVADTFRALKAEGRIALVDFSS